jgi:hypothetical protein
MASLRRQGSWETPLYDPETVRMFKLSANQGKSFLCSNAGSVWQWSQYRSAVL